jgi:hypothetical protein
VRSCHPRPGQRGSLAEYASELVTESVSTEADPSAVRKVIQALAVELSNAH